MWCVCVCEKQNLKDEHLERPTLKRGLKDDLLNYLSNFFELIQFWL